MATSASNIEFNPAVLIPVYNHHLAIPITLASILKHDIDVLLVDDGSQPSCQKVLADLAQQHKTRVHLVRLESNGGKGAALKVGFKRLHDLGYSHAFQIDADGQHDTTHLQYFLQRAQSNANTLIVGYPEYDESVPKLRYYSRYLTHIWVWINTLSFAIKDSMCGFRVYPLEKIVNQINSEPCGERMDFDTEILVRWLWSGERIINLPTRVNYPEDGVSHFNLWRDNYLISWMHTRLFLGMLARSPKLIARKFHDN